MNGMEAKLISAAKTGDREAFSLLMRGYERRLYQAVYSFLRDMEDAADVIQETFLRAYRGISGFDETRPMYPWLYRIARNLCINTARRAHRHRSTALTFEPTDERNLPDSQLLKEEERRRIRSCIDSLPEQAAEIIMLKHFQDCSYSEIADILGIPVGTVMSRLYNARKLLRHKLEKEA